MEEKQTEIKKKGMLLVFQVGNEYYAIEVMHTSGINAVPEVTSKMPNMEDYVFGIAPIQDSTVAIIDLARLLGIPAKKKIFEQQIFQITAEDTQKPICAILIDSVVKICSAESVKILPPPQINTSSFTPFIEGLFEISQEGESSKLVALIRLRDYIMQLKNPSKGTQEAS